MLRFGATFPNSRCAPAELGVDWVDGRPLLVGHDNQALGQLDLVAAALTFSRPGRAGTTAVNCPSESVSRGADDVSFAVVRLVDRDLGPGRREHACRGY